MIQYLEFNDLVSSEKYRNRYYDPALGRFLTEDPHPGLALNPSTVVQKYAYVLNNPINDIDPKGKIGPLAIIGIAALAGAIVNVAAYSLSGKGLTLAGFGQAIIVGAISGAVGAAISVAVPGLGGAMLGGFAGGFAGSLSNSWLSGEDPFTGKNLLKASISGSLGLLAGGFAYHISAGMAGWIHAAGREFSSNVSTGFGAAGATAVTDEAIEQIYRIPALP